MISFQPQLASLSPKRKYYVSFLAAAPVGHDAPKKSRRAVVMFSCSYPTHRC